ncbi:MAG: 2-amino-4-hydroxy-6-hydroxymethyldihydropteridine diphosphokinase [Parachlamydiaceae bacterium]
MITVYLSLGGNTGRVSFRLKQALKMLCDEERILKLRYSHFYTTAPHEMSTPHWFTNAVCSFETLLSLDEVFLITQSIEIQLGKIAKPKNADRPIDLDILFYGDQISHKSDLEVPHPRWKERLFVLVPLADLTSEVLLFGLMGQEHYVVRDLIASLLIQSTQEIYLLEKNPDL